MDFISEDAIVSYLQTLANDENLSPGARAACSAGARRFALYVTERVQMQSENESLRADLEQQKATIEHLQSEKGVFGEPAAWQDTRAERAQLQSDKTDIEVLAERLAKVEDRLAANVLYAGRAHGRITYIAETMGQRIAELVEKTGGTIPGHEPTTEEDLRRHAGKIESAAIMPEQRDPGAKRDTYGRGDEVRVDMALTQGGRRIFGWYTVEHFGGAGSSYTVQVSPTEDRERNGKRLYWIKPEDVLEVRKAAR